MPANLENSVSSQRTGKGQFSFQSQRRTMPKNVLTTTQLWSFHMLARECQPTLIFLPGKSRGRRSLEGCSPWDRWGSDTTERLHFDFSLSCIGEGNGNPLQCSCLENPRDGGAWWAAVYGVAQSRTWLKRLSSSSSSTYASMGYSNNLINSLSYVTLFPSLWSHLWKKDLFFFT